MIAADSPPLREALERLLRSVDHIRSGVKGDEPGAGDIVVAPAADCPPDCCAELVARGVNVIVLAAVPRPREQAAYNAAGVYAYVPMAVDTTELTDAIAAALRATATG